MTDEQIVEQLATKMMGWVREAGPDGDWYDDQNFVGSSPPTEYFDWNPLTDYEASRQVRDKLTAMGILWRLSWNGKVFSLLSGTIEQPRLGVVEVEADTEERAVRQ